MARQSNHPLFPDTDRVKDALRVLLHSCGGQFHALWAKDTYEPLADYFRLDQKARSILRSEHLGDGRDEAYWHTWAQWAKDRLVDAGELKCPRRGLWMLTVAGIDRAERTLKRFDNAATGVFDLHRYDEIDAILTKPAAEITLEDLGL